MPATEESLDVECSVLKAVGYHPKICQLHRIMRLHDEVWLVMEYMEGFFWLLPMNSANTGGDLRLVATWPRERFSEPEIAYVAREMLLGIAFLHEQQLAHRDLKSKKYSTVVASAHKGDQCYVNNSGGSQAG